MVASRSPSKAPAYGHELAELILAHHQASNAAPGLRLMTERQLAVDLGVTRTMIRQALAILEAEGRVSREVGRGTFLRDPDGRGTILAAGQSEPVTTKSARPTSWPPEGLSSPKCSRSWSRGRQRRDFEEMRRCLEGGATAQSYEEFEVWDFALHHAIMAASRNRLLLDMYAIIERARRGAIWGSLQAAQRFLRAAGRTTSRTTSR